MAERPSTFFESRRRHAVDVKGRKVVGTVLWNRATGSAFVAGDKVGVLKISEREADRIWQSEYTGGRPRMFNEPVRRVLVTLPERLLKLVCPDGKKRSLSEEIAKAIEEKKA